MRNLDLNYEGFEKYLFGAHRRDLDKQLGIQYLFKFDNNYGASVIKLWCSNGYDKDLWELAVIKYIDEKDCFGENKYELVYPIGLASDTLGQLTDEEVKNLLTKIKGL